VRELDPRRPLAILGWIAVGFVVFVVLLLIWLL
jgi:hypothetical protein